MGNRIYGQAPPIDYSDSDCDFETIKESETSECENNLENSKICLSGFSQGCMISLNVGLTSDENFNCIVGFSGKIIDKNHLAKRISSKTKILLLHGELDAVVPPSNLLDAKDFFLRNKIEVETHLISNCDHHIPIKASSIALNYIRKNFLF